MFFLLAALHPQPANNALSPAHPGFRWNPVSKLLRRVMAGRLCSLTRSAFAGPGSFQCVWGCSLMLCAGRADSKCGRRHVSGIGRRRHVRDCVLFELGRVHVGRERHVVGVPVGACSPWSLAASPLSWAMGGRFSH